MAESRQGRIWDRVFSDRVCVVFCAGALLVLVPLFAAPALNDYRVSDSFRLVGQIDFPAAFRYFRGTTGFGRNEYRPMVMLTYALDHLIWGGRPFGYHFTNVLLHTANSILLLFVLRCLTGNLLLAFSATVLFSVHPTHHSRIAWIAARDSSVCLLFLLVSWWAYLSFRRGPTDAGAASLPGFERKHFKQAVSWIAFALALLSYEGAVSFPFVLFGMELLFSRRGECGAERLRQSLRETLPFFLLLMGYIAAWLILFQGKVGAYDLDLTLRGMGRDFYRLHYRLFHHVQHWLGLFYLLIAYLLWRQGKEQTPLLWFSLLVLWVGYLPFFPIYGYADRFGFVSCVGVSLFLCLPMREVTRSGMNKASPSAVVPALVLALLVGYYTRSTGQRFQQWTEAGRIADSILTQVKVMQPSFPPNARLVFEQIPAMHGEAYVFPIAFRAALRSKYGSVPLEIFYYPTVMEASAREELLMKEPAYHFRYLPAQERLVEVGGGRVSTASVQ